MFFILKLFKCIALQDSMLKYKIVSNDNFVFVCPCVLVYPRLNRSFDQLKHQKKIITNYGSASCNY